MSIDAAFKMTVGPREFCAYVDCRGYEAFPVTNTIAASEGQPLEVVGYDLRGPRGNKTFVPKGKDGKLSIEAAALWCDGVDYATTKINRKGK